MSIATRAVFDQSEVRSGNNVLVQGPGPIGTLTAAVADTMGANVLVSGLEQDSESRLPHVDEIGDIETLDVETEDLDERADAFTDSIGFDVVFDATGHRTGVETSADVVRKGGQIVVVGIPGEASELLMTPLVRGEIEVNTSYGSLWRNFEQALRLMDNGAVRPETVIDRTYPVSSASKAIEGFLNSETVKPVFKFNGV